MACWLHGVAPPATSAASGHVPLTAQVESCAEGRETVVHLTAGANTFRLANKIN